MVLVKFYKIVCNKTGLVYYGSTTEKYLCDRLSKHVYDYRHGHKMRSRLVLENNDYKIELVEELECEDKHARNAKERYYIENNECVNLQLPGRTKKEYDDEYRIKNREVKNQKSREYYQTIKHKRRIKIKCPHCEKEITKPNLKAHVKRMHQ